MHIKITTLAAAALLLGAPVLAAHSETMNNSNSASKYAPGHLQKKPGQAQQFAPGQRQRYPGQARQFAPGHEKQRTTTGAGGAISGGGGSGR
jgi:hypothetical protein